MTRSLRGDDALVAHATCFYKDLFGPSTPSGILMEPGYWDKSKRVSEHDNIELSKQFSEAEIKEAIFSMEKNIAPGPDHFPVEFYQ